jgi:hypothetical protein
MVIRRVGLKRMAKRTARLVPELGEPKVTQGSCSKSALGGPQAAAPLVRVMQSEG